MGGEKKVIKGSTDRSIINSYIALSFLIIFFKLMSMSLITDSASTFFYIVYGFVAIFAFSSYLKTKIMSNNQAYLLTVIFIFLAVLAIKAILLTQIPLLIAYLTERQIGIKVKRLCIGLIFGLILLAICLPWYDGKEVSREYSPNNQYIVTIEKVQYYSEFRTYKVHLGMFRTKRLSFKITYGEHPKIQWLSDERIRTGFVGNPGAEFGVNSWQGIYMFYRDYEENFFEKLANILFLLTVISILASVRNKTEYGAFFKRADLYK